MKIDTIFGIVETVILIITLFYMIRQIKINTKTIEVSQYHNAMQLMFEWRRDVQNENSLVKHYEEVDYFKEIFDEFGVGFYFHSLKLFSTLEMFYMLHEKKVIDNNMMDSWKNNAIVLMQPGKNRKLWKKLHEINIYNNKFTIWLDNIVEEIEK